MSVLRVAISREPDDKLAETRISMGSAPGGLGSYLVFRGDPEKVVELLEQLTAIAKVALPAGRYDDKRGRPQG